MVRLGCMTEVKRKGPLLPPAVSRDAVRVPRSRSVVSDGPTVSMMRWLLCARIVNQGVCSPPTHPINPGTRSHRVADGMGTRLASDGRGLAGALLPHPPAHRRQTGPNNDQQHPTRSAVVSIADSSALMPLRIPDTIFNIRPLETAAPIVDGPGAHAHIGRIVQGSPY